MAIGSIYNTFPNGRPSGLPENLVEQLVDVKRQQLVNPIDQDISESQSRIDTYTSLNSKLRELFKAAENLDSTLSFNEYSVSSNDESVVSASASISAQTGSYTIDVSQVAQANNHLLRADARRVGYDKGGALAGIADASDANSINDGVALSFQHDGSTYNYTTDSNTTLNSLAETINDASNGVRAFVTNIGSSDNPEYTLDLQSETAATEITKDGTNPGVSLNSELFYDADSGTSLTNSQAEVGAGIRDADSSVLISDGISVSFHHGGTEYSYTTDNETTLNSLADAINDDDNGVTATVTNVGTTDTPQYAMTLKSETTGSGENRITNDAGDTGIDVSDGADLFAGGLSQEETLAGRDAQFSVDNVGYTRSSNEVTDVIQGITLNITGQGSSQIEAALDIETITQNVQSLVDNFNGLDGYMDEKASYNIQTGKAGPLFNDSIAGVVSNRVRSIFNTPISGTSDSAFQYLSDIGLEMQRGGEIKFDTATFQSALESNPEDVERLFVGENGAAGKLNTFLKEYTSSSYGIIPETIDRINENIADSEEDKTQALDSLNSYRGRLVEKYAALESTVLKYQSMEDQLNSIIDTWDNGD